MTDVVERSSAVESGNRRRRVLLVFAGSTLAAFTLTVALAELRFIPLQVGDAYFYARMGVGYPADQIAAPFGQRILVPMLVAGLPFRVPWGFAVVSSVMLGGTFTAMHRLLTGLFTRRVAWIGLAMLAVSGLVYNVLVTPLLVDGVVLLAAAIVFVCLVEDRWTPLLLVMPLAVAGHELSLVLLVPIAITAWRRKKLPDAAVAGVLAVGMWWVLHRSGWVVPVNDRSNLLDAEHREEMVHWNAAKYGTTVGAVWAHVLGSYGVAWLLMPAGWKNGNRVLKDGVWMLPACAVLCLTGSDWGRMFLPVMPVVIGLACAAVAGASPDEAEPSATFVPVERGHDDDAGTASPGRQVVETAAATTAVPVRP